MTLRSSPTVLFLSFCLTTSLATWACSSAPAAPAGTGTSDAGTDPSPTTEGDDAGVDARVPKAPRCTTPRPADPPVPTAAPTSGFFATHPLPQLQNKGGPTLASARLVPIFFQGDAYADDLEDFVASVGCTPYWRSAVGEYGVGDALAMPAVHLDESPPATITDGEIEAWLTKQLTTAGSPVGAPVKDAVYVIFYPASTTIVEQGAKSCHAFGGYHTDVTLPDGQQVAYAAIPRCGSFGGLSGVDEVVGAASHEIMEAVTDPYNKETPGYAYADDDHLVWTYVIGSECGDLCASAPDPFFKPDGYPFAVQRNWSNLAAHAGGDPCVPKSNEAFFTAAPKLDDQVSMFGMGMTRGVSVPAGTSKSIDVDLYSDDPSAAIQVMVIDAGQLFGQPGASSYALDRSTGKSGETLHLSITTPAGAKEAEAFAILASAGTRKRIAWAGAVGH